MQTRIYRNKYVNGSVNSEGHLIIKKKPGADLIPTNDPDLGLFARIRNFPASDTDPDSRP
jgi:hypothetical protein